MADWIRVLRELDQTIAELRTDRCFEPLFRGHSDGSWSLLPSLGRRQFEDAFENSLFYDFLTYSAPHVQSGYGDWDILFAMRHHGLPTRLLDWTQSFATALYFAVQGVCRNPCIWVLNPYKLNQLSSGEEGLKHPRDLESYSDYFIEEPTEKKTFPGKIVSLLANKNSPRLLAQRGMFTMHAELSSCLEELYPECVRKIEVPDSAISDARTFLKYAGCDTYALFPDLDGLSRWLAEAYDIESIPYRVISKAAKTGA